MDVVAWLRGLGLEQYAPAFRDNDVVSKQPGPSQLNAFALHFIGGDLQDHTELNNVIGAYIHNQNGKVVWDCSSASIEAYTKAVNFDPKFPFSYFYRASCNRLNDADQWQKDADTAQRLFRITTQIPGHNQNHDEMLRMLDRGDLGRPPG